MCVRLGNSRLNELVVVTSLKWSANNRAADRMKISKPTSLAISWQSGKVRKSFRRKRNEQEKYLRVAL